MSAPGRFSRRRPDVPRCPNNGRPMRPGRLTSLGRQESGQSHHVPTYHRAAHPRLRISDFFFQRPNGPRISRERQGWRGGCVAGDSPRCSRRDSQARRLHTLVRRLRFLPQSADKIDQRSAQLSQPIVMLLAMQKRLVVEPNPTDLNQLEIRESVGRG